MQCRTEQTETVKIYALRNRFTTVTFSHRWWWWLLLTVCVCVCECVDFVLSSSLLLADCLIAFLNSGGEAVTLSVAQHNNT